MTIDFGKPTTFNRFLVQEYIPLGQRVKSFTVEAFVDGEWKEVAKATTIGYKRILRFHTVKATKLRFTVTDAKSCPLISNIEIYDAPQILAAPSVIRNQSGEIQITAADFESEIFYTLDGTNPTINSRKYVAPFKTSDGKVKVICIAHDSITNKNSSVTEERFDIAKKLWKFIGIDDPKAYNILDGDPGTQWYQDNRVKMPVDLVIDLGKVENVSGFRYLPDQNWWAKGIISNYQLYISQDNIEWRLVDKGEFSNIKNNPAWQNKSFQTVKARYIKFRALKNTQDDDAVGYADVDIITAN